MIIRAWSRIAALLVRLIVSWCTPRERFVDYVHAGRAYMRRYVISGFRSGDAPQKGWRAWLPNLYLHHIQAPDADASLHDHPWPWGVSVILLGGYREARLVIPPFLPRPDTFAPIDRFKSRLDAMIIGSDTVWLAHFKRFGRYEPGDVRSRTFRAPAINVLRGDTFHRIAEIEPCKHPSARRSIAYSGARRGGTWTLFLAGPRAAGKPWGYIVEGRGYVPQQTRHAELNATEVRPGAPA